MARNRKRAKERRARRPQPVASTRVERQRAAAERLAPPPEEALEETSSDALEDSSDALEEQAAPDPLEHASPDVELADAQLALGRAEAEAGVEGEIMAEDDLNEADALGEEADAELAGEAEPDGRDPDAGIPSEPVQADGRERAAAVSPIPARSEATARAGALAAPARPHSRLVHFLQGSWRELQRVQWPDRRQVIQATGVVIGFVIIAGIFLGVADTVAGKIMDFILK